MVKHSFKYDYGETVRIAASAPPPLKPGAEVAVVGMTQIEHPRELLGSMCPPGTIAYLIEFSDGSSVEVPENCIETRNE